MKSPPFRLDQVRVYVFESRSAQYKHSKIYNFTVASVQAGLARVFPSIVAVPFVVSRQSSPFLPLTEALTVRKRPKSTPTHATMAEGKAVRWHRMPFGQFVSYEASRPMFRPFLIGAAISLVVCGVLPARGATQEDKEASKFWQRVNGKH